MPRRNQAPVVTAQMYRHFAILTVAATLVLALFADGSSRAAAASEVRPQPVATSAVSSELQGADDQELGSFGSDSGLDESFGQPMDAAGATVDDGSIVLPASLSGSGLVPAGYAIYGVSAEEWAERSAMQSDERASQVEGLLAASRARAGEATASE